MILFEFENFLFNIIFSYDLSYLLFFIIEIFIFSLFFNAYKKWKLLVYQRWYK